MGCNAAPTRCQGSFPLAPMTAPRSLPPLLVGLDSAISLARQAWGMPRRQKLKSRFLGLKDFQQAVPIRLAREAILHPIHQGFGFSRNRFDRFKALDELIHQGLRFLRTGANRFEAIDQRLSHDGRYPFYGHDNEEEAGFIPSHPRCGTGSSEGHLGADAAA